MAWSMPHGVGVVEMRAWKPACAGDSGYFPRGIVPGSRPRRAENSGMTMVWVLSPFVLRAVAGACVGRRTGQPTAAAGGAAARGVWGGLGDSFAVGLGAVAGACVDHGSGQARMPPQERRHEDSFLFLRFVGGVVRFPEGCCRSGNAKQSFAGRIPKRSLGTTQV